MNCRISVHRAFLLGIAILSFISVSCDRISKARKEQAFSRFVFANSNSVQVIAYRSEQTILGGGSYVVTFKASELELQRIAKATGFTAVPIDSEPNHWRLDLCNAVIDRLGFKDLRVEGTFDCYSKSTSSNRSRIFYDKTNNAAIFMGLGRFAK